MPRRPQQGELFSVSEVGLRLHVSLSTVWRMIRRGELQTVKVGARRLVAGSSLKAVSTPPPSRRVPVFTKAHPIFGMIGAGRSGGAGPGSSDKHAVLSR